MVDSMVNAVIVVAEHIIDHPIEEEYIIVIEQEVKIIRVITFTQSIEDTTSIYFIINFNVIKINLAKLEECIAVEVLGDNLITLVAINFEQDCTIIDYIVESIANFSYLSLDTFNFSVYCCINLI